MSPDTLSEDRPRGYSRAARFIHWVMAFIMITMSIAGIWMATGDLWGGKFPALRGQLYDCLLYTSPSPRDRQKSRMPSSA